MKFIEPMLACALPERFSPQPGEWVAEEKFDGHRIISQVVDGRVKAWGRYGIERALPKQIREALALLPNGTYDGELLVPGKRSYGVTVVEDQHLLVYVVFDVLELLGRDLVAIKATWLERRAFLDEIFNRCFSPEHNEDSGCGSSACWKHAGQATSSPVYLSTAWPVEGPLRIEELALEIWGRDGEGLVLKRTSATYQPGKRPKNTWLKVKKLQSATLTLKDFAAGKMGPHAVMVLEDAEGYTTSVKWKSLAELAAIDAGPAQFIGRKVVIEFQERTTDGGYRHPRFDRWEDR